jgi:glucosamine 6-phosphate synthetase-like amidotransferase/phosphosugar isomerase protein
MCSIIGSYNKDKFIELLELNRYRGAFSHSLTLYRPEGTTLTFKGFGDFNLKLLDNVQTDDYILGHCQAPTGGLVKSFDRIHPYVNNTIKLLHNGIIKTQEVQRINEIINSKHQWDTQLLGEYISEDFNKLSDIEGSFACVCIKNNKLYMFRNAISPLYQDIYCNISSTKFDDSEMIDNNVIYQLREIHYFRVDSFNNTHNPYYF